MTKCHKSVDSANSTNKAAISHGESVNSNRTQTKHADTASKGVNSQSSSTRKADTAIKHKQKADTATTNVNQSLPEDADTANMTNSENECNADELVESLMVNPMATSTVTGETTHETVLDDTQQEFDQEDGVGPPINEKLATVLKTMAKGKLDEEKLKKKCDTHKRPKNVDQPTVPKVNPEIWSILDHQTRTNDLRMQRKQKLLIKAVNALAYSCDVCIKSGSGTMTDLVKNMTDAVSLNLKVVHEISLERRTKILASPNVNKKYRKLSTDLPVTTFLFGDDLKAILSSTDSTSKLGNNYNQSPRGKKSPPPPKKKNKTKQNKQKTGHGNGGTVGDRTEGRLGCRAVGAEATEAREGAN